MDLADLENDMARAVEAQDFETAAALRDRLAELRAATNPRCREPRRMGLGTDQPAHVTLEGWTPPARPDPMTAGHNGAVGVRR
jgi:excinuclease UvrABC nuclease subunit